MGLLSYLKPVKGSKNPPSQPLHLISNATMLPPTFSSGMMTPTTPMSSSSNLSTQVRWNIMADYLRLQQVSRQWTDGHDQGVVMKRSRGDYICSPPDLKDKEEGFMRAIEMLNVQVAITVDSPVIKRFVGSDHIALPNGLRLQVIPNLSALPSCQKNQSAAFVDDRAQLVVWDDDPNLIMERITTLEQSLLQIIWNGDTPDATIQWQDDKKGEIDVTVAEVQDNDSASSVDIESGSAAASPQKRRKLFLAYPMISGMAIMLSIGAMGGSWGDVAREVSLDGSYLRCVLVLMFPFVAWASLFFWQAASTSLFQLFGPIDQIKQNNRFYSGMRPPRLSRNRPGGLPYITIQMPCYKEGLDSVLKPTIRSLKEAIATYEMQGGRANIFVNDDGLHIISEAERNIRKEYFDENDIGWVARPAHKSKWKYAGEEKEFVRRGKFKKASNMNYAMWVSCRVEEKLLARQQDNWTALEEGKAYDECLKEVIEEDEGRTWAEGNIRFGDYVLIIDCDTRVPRDCLLDAVSEMELNPDVAILQHASGVMNVTSSFFENGITFFTNLVYSQIKYAVASGDVAPFVGHNAILRWEAIQYIGYECPLDGREKWWSEETVSEDFDMALRLQGAGYIVRLAGYTAPDGAKYDEGVSITVYDELARWEKYAYGCNELIFHPLCYWPTRGPFTKLFRDFVRSCIPLSSKLTIMAYVGTYYAIGSTWIFSFVNYFAVGWYGGWLDAYYRPSFSTYLSLIVVFTLLGNVALAVMRWRLNEKGLLKALMENCSWIPLMAIFLGGLSLHVSQALLSHMFGIDMQWGSTNKEASSQLSFPKALRQTLAKFRFTYFFCAACAIAMIVLYRFVPAFWQIRSFVAIWPLAVLVVSHAALPVVLNPDLIGFGW